MTRKSKKESSQQRNLDAETEFAYRWKGSNFEMCMRSTVFIRN